MSIDAIGSVSRLSSTLDVDKHFMLGSHKAIKALRSLENGFKHLNLAVKHVLLQNTWTLDVKIVGQTNRQMNGWINDAYSDVSSWLKIKYVLMVMIFISWYF